jgi:hypothetical protein
VVFAQFGVLMLCCLRRQMWGCLVRNSREWIRLISVYFPRELLPPAVAYVQACQP